VITFFVIAVVASRMLNEMFETADEESITVRKDQLGLVGVNLEKASVREHEAENSEGEVQK
jgi:hypothetical protein